MKTYKTITKILIGFLIAGAVALATSCSEVTDVGNASSAGGFGRIVLTITDDYNLTEIKLFGVQNGRTTYSGSWATSAALKNATVKIPVGEYNFIFNCKYNGNAMSGTCQGIIRENETTPLTFNLEYGSTTPPRPSTDDEDDEAERVLTGTIVNVEAGKPEYDYNGLYKVMDWDATKFVFTTKTSTEGVSGVFPSAEEWLASDDLSSGQVAILGGCETKYNATANQCDYLKLKKESGKLKFDVPIDTKFIVFYCKNANSGGTTVAMKVSLADGSADSKSVTVNAPNSGSYVYQKFEYTLTATDGEDSKSVIIENTDNTSGLNIKKIQVYATSPWNRAKKTTSAKVPSSSNTASQKYGTTEDVKTLSPTAAPVTTGSSI